MENSGHVPVLMEHTLELLSPQPGDRYLDCTLGRGGHACVIADLLGPEGMVYGTDLDAGNRLYAERELEKTGTPFLTRHANFADALEWFEEDELERPNLLLADLGFASNQMDDGERGFSFQEEAPLDMRLNQKQSLTAADLIARLSEVDLANTIYEYGEEGRSRGIARRIVEERRKSPIRDTKRLANICVKAYGKSGGRFKIHPATRTFMALRIAVNEELKNLDRLLDDLPDLMSEGGIAAIISFHSLEDRRVKLKFREWAKEGKGEILTKKPWIADPAEIRSNPRSRSAKIRAIRLIKA